MINLNLANSSILTAVSSGLHFVQIAVSARTFLISTVLEDPAKSTPTLPNDPLVAPGWGNLAYLGAFVFIALAVTIVGIVSRKFEHALILALVLSLGFIGFFLVFNH